MTFRNRTLLDLCHGAPRCFLAVDGFCTNRPDFAPAHSNLSRHGRGYAHKSADLFSVPACLACHGWLDAGHAPRQEKDDVFMRGFERWQLYLWENEKVRVS